MSEDEQDDALLEDLRKAVREVTAYYEELEGESPRAAAILAVAGLEDELERLLLTKFPGVSKKTWEEIAGPGFRPLGSFKARNDVAHAFGFYGRQTRAMLEKISAVRNKFAHDTGVRQFDDQALKPLLQGLSENPIASFKWDPKLSASQLRELFLGLVLKTEKALMEVRSDYLFPPALSQTQLP